MRRAWLALTACAVFGGCAGGGADSSRGPVMAGDTSTAVLLDESLAPKIQLAAQQGYRDPVTGAFVAETLLQNLTLEFLTLECRTIFKDDAGVTTETSTWKEVVLTPGGKAIVMAPSIRAGTTRFITQIRKK